MPRPFLILKFCWDQDQYLVLAHRVLIFNINIRSLAKFRLDDAHFKSKNRQGERQCSQSEILRVQKYWIAEPYDAKQKVSSTENVKHLGFKEETQQFADGLVNEHSVLVISALARFHGPSYCSRKSAGFDWTKKCPSISTEIEVPKLSSHIVLMLEHICKEHADYWKHSWPFMGPVRGDLEMINKKLESFGVLFYGNYTNQNMIFKYKSYVDPKQFCSDVLDPFSSH